MIYPPLNRGKCKHPERITCTGFKKEEKKWIPNNCPNINSCELKVGDARFGEVKKLEEELLKVFLKKWLKPSDENAIAQFENELEKIF